jgi:hypothetical protein
LTFNYKTKPIHKLHTYLKYGLSPLLHVSARLCHPQRVSKLNLDLTKIYLITFAIFISEFINGYCRPIQTDGVRESRNPADYKTSLDFLKQMTTHPS